MTPHVALAFFFFQMTPTTAVSSPIFTEIHFFQDSPCRGAWLTRHAPRGSRLQLPQAAEPTGFQFPRPSAPTPLEATTKIHQQTSDAFPNTQSTVYLALFTIKNSPSSKYC